jgi:hypothetical protein
MYSGMCQMSDHYSKVESPVKAVAELCQVAGQMFPAHCMISASQIVLHIADHRIDPLEDPASITHRTTAGQYGFMRKPSASIDKHIMELQQEANQRTAEGRRRQHIRSEPPATPVCLISRQSIH